MYTEVGKISKTTIEDLKKCLIDAPWEIHVSDVTEHHAFGCMDRVKKVKGIVDRWPIDNWEQIIFLRLPAGGKLYRHADEGFGYHIPIETNKDCVSLSYANGIKKEEHLGLGKIYLTDRSIEHESSNNGKTDRTHMIVMLKEYPDNE